MGVIAWIVLGAVAGLSRRRTPRAEVIDRRSYDDTGQPPA
jgi:hypothetical protein